MPAEIKGKKGKEFFVIIFMFFFPFYFKNKIK